MEPVQAVVGVLKNWREYSSPNSTRGRTHEGLKYINGHEQLAAKIILQKNWDGVRRQPIWHH